MIAAYPPTSKRTIGTMLLGPVPTPPKNPRSCTKTQSARQRAAPAATATRRALVFVFKKAAPVSARAVTANRLTPQPWAASKLPKAATQAERKWG